MVAMLRRQCFCVDLFWEKSSSTTSTSF